MPDPPRGSVCGRFEPCLRFTVDLIQRSTRWTDGRTTLAVASIVLILVLRSKVFVFVRRINYLSAECLSSPRLVAAVTRVVYLAKAVRYWSFCTRNPFCWKEEHPQASNDVGVWIGIGGLGESGVFRHRSCSCS